MDMIVCRNLTRQYGGLIAVDDLSLTVSRGELFGFLGPNGAGKTTTIKMMTGLLHPSAGTAILGGYDIRLHPLEAKRIFGYIPDNPFLYEKLTGLEFLHFMADLYSVPHRNRVQRIDSLLGLFGMENKRDALIQSYSRGMRQKLALSGALIHSPEIIFLDEPTVGLDPQSARTMQGVLRELCRQGVTVFISTHILNIAEKMCDRVAVVNRGRLIALGALADLQRDAVERRQANSGDGSSDGTLAGPLGLEEIFLELTGAPEEEDLAQYLRTGAESVGIME